MSLNQSNPMNWLGSLSSLSWVQRRFPTPAACPLVRGSTLFCAFYVSAPAGGEATKNPNYRHCRARHKKLYRFALGNFSL